MTPSRRAKLASPWAKPGRHARSISPMMAREGGALSVLAVRKDGVMLSWAGGPTATLERLAVGGRRGVGPDG